MAHGFAFFPGQGAQTPGMGKTLYEASAAAKAVFDRISNAVGASMTQLCFDTEIEVLSRTENSQLAIFTHSLAALAALRENGVQFEACAGFSLGEYTALVASEVLSLEDGAKIVQERGKLMQHAADTVNGGMAAILGLDDTAVEAACQACDGIVLPVNYNCPGQLVIAGERAALAQAVEKCKTAGARRAVPLAVSSAFHTPLMQAAAVDLRAFSTGFTFHTPTIPVYCNADGEILQTQNMPAHLERHMVSPVRWKSLVQNGINAGLTSGFEIGPGKTLTGFARKISKEFSVFTVETMENVLSLAK